jgi:hypothetical protein
MSVCFCTNTGREHFRFPISFYELEIDNVKDRYQVTYYIIFW